MLCQLLLQEIINSLQGGWIVIIKPDTMNVSSGILKINDILFMFNH